MLLFAGAISVSFTLGAPAAPHIAPTALTAGRFVIAAILMGALAAPLLRREHLRGLWRFVVLGGLLATYFVLMFEALRLTDPVSTGAVFTLTPLMAAGFGWILMRQVTTLVMTISLLLAACGAVWVVFRGDVDAVLGFRVGAGERIFFAGCAAHALYTPLGRMLHRGEPMIVYAFLGICGGALVTVGYGLEDIVATDWNGLPTIAWTAMIYVAIAATALTFFLLQYATQRLPAAKVMAYAYLVPVFVIIEEGVIGNGWVAPRVWLGVAAVVAGLLILLFERKRPER